MSSVDGVLVYGRWRRFGFRGRVFRNRHHCRLRLSRLGLISDLFASLLGFFGRLALAAPAPGGSRGRLRRGLFRLGLSGIGLGCDLFSCLLGFIKSLALAATTAGRPRGRRRSGLFRLGFRRTGVRCLGLG